MPRAARKVAHTATAPYPAHPGDRAPPAPQDTPIAQAVNQHPQAVCGEPQVSMPPQPTPSPGLPYPLTVTLPSQEVAPATSHPRRKANGVDRGKKQVTVHVESPYPLPDSEDHPSRIPSKAQLRMWKKSLHPALLSEIKSIRVCCLKLQRASLYRHRWSAVHMGHLSRAAQDMQPTLACPAYADVRCIDKGARGDSLPRHMNSCPAYRDMTAEQKQLFPEPVLATVGHIRAVKHMARFGYPLVQQPVALVWNSATPWAQPPPFAPYPPYVPQASSSFAPPPAPSVPLPQQPPVFAPQQHQLTPAPPQAGVQKPVVPAQQPLAAASHTSAVPAASATHRPDNRPRPRPMVKPLAATYSSFFSQLEQTRGSTASTPPAPSSVCQSPSAAKTTTTAPCVPLLQAVTAPSPASQPPKEQVLDRSASPQSSYSERPESAFDSPLLSFEDSPPTSVAESPSPSQDECATEETCTAPIGSPAPVEAPHVQLPIAASESSSVRTAASDFSMEMLFSLDDLSGPFRSSPVGEWLPQPISLPPVEDIAANIWSPAPSNASFGGGFLDIGDFNLFLDEHEHQFSTEFGQ